MARGGVAQSMSDPMCNSTSPADRRLRLGVGPPTPVGQVAARPIPSRNPASQSARLRSVRLGMGNESDVLWNNASPPLPPPGRTVMRVI